MPSWISERFAVLVEAINRRWVRWLGIAWAAVATWDTFVSQFIPEEAARRFPKVYQVLAMTSGWLTIEQWLLVGALILVAASVEYAYRRRPLELLEVSVKPIPTPSVRTASRRPPAAPITITSDKGRVRFDYSTHNGIAVVGEKDCEFRIGFSAAGRTAIHVYTMQRSRRSNLSRLAHVKDSSTGNVLRFDEHDSTSDHYVVSEGEYFLAENARGYFLQCKVLDIQHRRMGDDKDEIVFDYEINTNGSAEFRAL